MKKNNTLPLRLLDSTDFEQLSQEEKLSYLADAFKRLMEMDANRQGAGSASEQERDSTPLERQ